jgi:hypothetical protein
MIAEIRYGSGKIQLTRNGPRSGFDATVDDLIVAFRNVLAHGYATLDHTRVYEAASLKAPELLRFLEQLLVEYPEP